MLVVISGAIPQLTAAVGTIEQPGKHTDNAGFCGPAAVLAKENIKKVECLEYPELGMEAVRKIYVEDFPAFIIVDDKGNDFFADFKH